MNSKQYWENKIIEWEDSVKGVNKVSFIEKVATVFRKPLQYRSSMSLQLLRPFVHEKIVLDLGCGSGFFDMALYDLAKPSKIIGIDISSQAIKRAQKTANERNLMEICQFFEGDAGRMSLPKVDVTIGLGFLDYLTLSEIKFLFERLKSKYFLFSFSERKLSVLRFMHILYMLSQSCPKHFYNTKVEIKQCIGEKFGATIFLNDRHLSFSCLVHNLPV